MLLPALLSGCSRQETFYLRCTGTLSSNTSGERQEFPIDVVYRLNEAENSVFSRNPDGTYENACPRDKCSGVEFGDRFIKWTWGSAETRNAQATARVVIDRTTGEATTSSDVLTRGPSPELYSTDNADLRCLKLQGEPELRKF